MTICVLYHSETGITKSFAAAIQKQLEQKGHKVVNHQLKSLAPIKQASVRDKQEISFEALPNPAEFDALLFGGPVWAFGPSPAIVAAIRQMVLKGKNCAGFATMGFPFGWMGGNAALRYMERELRTKGAQIIPGAICTRATKDIATLMQKRATALATAF
jgi:flavodoxin